MSVLIEGIGIPQPRAQPESSPSLGARIKGRVFGQGPGESNRLYAADAAVPPGARASRIGGIGAGTGAEIGDGRPRQALGETRTDERISPVQVQNELSNFMGNMVRTAIDFQSEIDRRPPNPANGDPMEETTRHLLSFARRTPGTEIMEPDWDKITEYVKDDFNRANVMELLQQQLSLEMIGIARIFQPVNPTEMHNIDPNDFRLRVQELRAAAIPRIRDWATNNPDSFVALLASMAVGGAGGIGGGLGGVLVGAAGGGGLVAGIDRLIRVDQQAIDFGLQEFQGIDQALTDHQRAWLDFSVGRMAGRGAAEQNIPALLQSVSEQLVTKANFVRAYGREGDLGRMQALPEGFILNPAQNAPETGILRFTADVRREWERLGGGNGNQVDQIARWTRARETIIARNFREQARGVITERDRDRSRARLDARAADLTPTTPGDMRTTPAFERDVAQLDRDKARYEEEKGRLIDKPSGYDEVVEERVGVGEESRLTVKGEVDHISSRLRADRIGGDTPVEVTPSDLHEFKFSLQVPGQTLGIDVPVTSTVFRTIEAQIDDARNNLSTATRAAIPLLNTPQGGAPQAIQAAPLVDQLLEVEALWDAEYASNITYGSNATEQQIAAQEKRATSTADRRYARVRSQLRGAVARLTARVSALESLREDYVVKQQALNNAENALIGQREFVQPSTFQTEHARVTAQNWTITPDLLRTETIDQLMARINAAHGGGAAPTVPGTWPVADNNNSQRRQQVIRAIAEARAEDFESRDALSQSRGTNLNLVTNAGAGITADQLLSSNRDRIIDQFNANLGAAPAGWDTMPAEQRERVVEDAIAEARTRALRRNGLTFDVPREDYDRMLEQVEERRTTQSPTALEHQTHLVHIARHPWGMDGDQSRYDAMVSEIDDQVREGTMWRNLVDRETVVNRIHPTAATGDPRLISEADSFTPSERSMPVPAGGQPETPLRGYTELVDMLFNYKTNREPGQGRERMFQRIYTELLPPRVLGRLITSELSNFGAWVVPNTNAGLAGVFQVLEQRIAAGEIRGIHMRRVIDAAMRHVAAQGLQQ